MQCGEFTLRTLPEELHNANLLVNRIRRDGRECRLRLAHAWTSYSPRYAHRTDQQKSREQVGRAGKIPATIRTDKARKHRREQKRSDHKSDTATTAERALELSLLRRIHPARHN